MVIFVLVILIIHDQRKNSEKIPIFKIESAFDKN